MASMVTAIGLSGPFEHDTSDIHLLRGFSYDLGKRLTVYFNDKPFAWATLPVSTLALTIRFSSNFKGVVSGSEITGNGVKLDTHGGLVTALTTAGSHPRTSFIVAIEAEGTSVKDGPIRIYVRIHIHNDVIHKWLTPSMLTVRRGMADKAKPERTATRFAAYAQFDDGTTGDVTNYCGFRDSLAPLNPNFIKWTPLTHVEGQLDGLIKVPAGSVAGSEVEVTATFPASLKGGTAKGKIKISDEWLSTKKNTALLAAESAGAAKKDDVPNILFLAEGYTTADQNLFNSSVVQLIQQIKTENLFEPFSTLLGSMNYWYHFTPSGERGVTNENEYYKISETATGQVLNAVPISRKPQEKKILTLADVNTWSLEDLLFHAGHPYPTQTKATLKNDWYETLVLHADATQNRALIDAIYAKANLADDWLKMTDRKLINRKDTFFGVTIGFIPDANSRPNLDHGLFRLQKHRIDRDKLNGLLATMEDEKGQSLDGVWNHKADGSGGKDFDLIVIIINNHYGRCINADGYFFITCQKKESSIDKIKVAKDATSPPGRNAWIEATPTPPLKLPFMSGQTMAHELAHSFALDDEYGNHMVGTPEEIETKHYYKFPPLENGVPDTDAINQLSKSPNLVAESAITNAGGDVIAEKIKWRWHRIENAGIVTGPIADAGGGVFEIPVTPNLAVKFKKDEIVFLRLRAPRNFTTDDLEVVSYHGPDHEIEVKPSTGSHITKGMMLLFYWGSRIIGGTTVKHYSFVSKVSGLPNSNFKIFMIEGHQKYSAGDKLKLQLPEQSILNDLENTTISVPLKVTANQTTDKVMVIAETGPLTLSDMKQFVKSSILYKPVEALPEVKTASYRFSEILPKNVMSAIEVKKLPLTGKPSKFDDKPQQAMIPEYWNTIKFPKKWCFVKKTLAVGVYSGGALFHTGIYHPSGHCMMRAYSWNEATQFCPVCRYILADMIDPTKHGEIDIQIQATYPLKK